VLDRDRQCFQSGRLALEMAQQIAAHQSSRTTEVYDRRGDDVSLDDEKLIRICNINSVSQPQFCSFLEGFFPTSALVAHLKAWTMKVALNPEELDGGRPAGRPARKRTLKKARYHRVAERAWLPSWISP
jgi:hypothetical protein